MTLSQPYSDSQRGFRQLVRRVRCYGSPNVIEGDISHRHRNVVVRRIEPSTHADADGASDVVENQITEGNILELRAGIALEFDGTTINFMQDAVRNRNISRASAAKAKNRPARAEVRIGYSNIAAGSEQGTRIVTLLHHAIADSHMFHAYKVETVVIPVDAVVNVDTVEVNPLALNDPNAVIGAVE